MKFYGITSNGTRLDLGKPTAVIMNFDSDAPADILRAEFSPESMWDELFEIEL